MKASDASQILLDPAIRDWVLLPIMIIMVLVGILRHYATLLMQPQITLDAKLIREK